MENNQSPQNNNQQQKHEKTRKTLKIVGGIIGAIGLILAIVAFADFFLAFNTEGQPKLFFLSFIGLPMLAVGLILLMMGFRRELARFFKNDSMPVVKEAADELSPTIANISKLVKSDSFSDVTKATSGLASSFSNVADAVNEKNADSIVCPSCSTINDKGSVYCKKCGSPLENTCPHCGAKIDSDSDFCNKCGKSIK